MPRAYDDIRQYLNSRELGAKQKLGSKSRVHRELYSDIKCFRSWDPTKTSDDTHHGGIFNFDFSSDGSLLVAACERKSVLMFDPFNANLIKAKNNAHADCVNCVRFLDSRCFATCSDDTTVCLWDARYFKQPYRTLRGHSNWVKNIEYDHNQGLLVTSGFDGSIYTWNINSYTDNGVEFKRVFHTNGLMRSKLTPDASKLVIATAGGYLMVIHDLDLNHLSEDLHGFKPNMYRLMQMSESPLRQAYVYNHLFTRKRNRVEFISDFPAQDEAEMIASLEIHPQGWCVVSRNISSDENTEWTCIHDIQDFDSENEDEIDSEKVMAVRRDRNSVNHLISSGLAASDILQSANENLQQQMEQPVITSSAPGVHTFNSNFLTRPQVTVSNQTTNVQASISLARPRFEVRYSSSTSSGNSSVGASTSGVQVFGRTASSNTTTSNNNTTNNSDSSDGQETDASVDNVDTGIGDTPAALSRQAVLRIGDSVTLIIRSGSQVAERTLLLLGQQNQQLITQNQQQSDNEKDSTNEHIKIHKNKTRLTHYIEEPNVGRGFIKEVCFSNDGRLVCSPFSFGVRLLAFDPDCNELCDTVPGQPLQLHEVTSNMSHQSTVVTTKFSPVHKLLVSGCLNGKIGFHQPVL